MFRGFIQRKFETSEEAYEAIHADGAAYVRAKKFGTDHRIWAAKRDHASREYNRLRKLGR